MSEFDRGAKQRGRAGRRTSQPWSRADLINLSIFAFQPDATIAQVNVQNTWYTVLNTTNARLYSLEMITVGFAETLQMRLTVDGQAMTATVNANDSTVYYVAKDQTTDGLLALATPINPNTYCPLDGKAVKVEVRKTTATGAGTLYSRVVYGRLT
jgi:hypothetical protein